MNERFNQLPEERQQQILNGAMQAFAEHGYNKCSMADVAVYAGVSKALLFHYFNTKIELFDYLNTYANTLKRQTRQKHVMKPDDDLLEAFTKLVKQRVSLVQLNPVANRFLDQAALAESTQRAEQDIVDLQKADMHRLRKGYKDTEVIKLLGWVADGLIEEHFSANSNASDSLADLDTWVSNLKKMLYKDKHQ